jgi:hypothetical protein
MVLHSAIMVRGQDVLRLGSAEKRKRGYESSEGQNLQVLAMSICQRAGNINVVNTAQDQAAFRDIT